MIEFLKNLFNQPWIGALLGLIGILFGVYQIFRRQKGKLVYQTNSRRLIGSKYSKLPSDVEVLFKGTNVPSLSSTRVIIWNNGRSAIRKEDISSTDPLKIKLESDEEILDVNILSKTRDANQFEAETNKDNKNSINIDFEFLDQDDGVYLEILHTGSSDIRIIGTLIGIPEGAKYLGSTPTDRSRYKKMLENKDDEEDSDQTFGEFISNKMTEAILMVFTNLIPITKFMFFISILFLGYAMFPSFIANLFPDYFKISKSPESRIPVIIFGLIYLFFGFIFIWIERRRYPKELELSDN